MVLDDFLAFQRTLALRAAVEMELFTRIGAGTQTASALAAECGAEARCMRILCDYLAIHGHLLKEADRYSLPLHSRLYLATTSPAYLGCAIQFLASDSMMQSFCRLAEAVGNGGASHRNAILSGASHWVAFARAMAPLARPVAQIAAAALEVESRGPIRVLDVAAGHGLYGLAIAARNPTAQIVALDRPEVLEVAAENARRAGVTEQYRLLPGDVFEVELEGPYDLILLANFAHHFDRAANISLFRKCRGALNAAGRLALIEYITNDDRISPAEDAAFALTMLATTEGGDVYTFREFSDMLRDAGFLEVQRPDVGDLPQWFIVASG
jgi:2-polyprenyl-3-methyl-5-hydroxy-6-metoxy-1,4-benzoquinol methylase